MERQRFFPEPTHCSKAVGLNEYGKRTFVSRPYELRDVIRARLAGGWFAPDTEFASAAAMLCANVHRKVLLKVFSTIGDEEA
jgi:hypothetical protein